MAGERPAWESDPMFLSEYERQYPHESAADAILRLRVDLGWTQQDLAERVGTAQSVIARAESGRHSFQIDLLKRVANAAGATWRPVFTPMDHDDKSIIVLANVVGATTARYVMTGHLDDATGDAVHPLTVNAGG